jgi:hypothetical protein
MYQSQVIVSQQPSAVADTVGSILLRQNVPIRFGWIFVDQK